jgi:hypothetical protein
MEPDAKAKWLEALRSGKYQRAQQQLEKAGSYCCLGVLCETMGWEYEPEDDEPETHLTRRVRLSGKAINALMRINDGTLHEGDTDEQVLASSVSGYEPGTGAAFTSIADWIEAHL